MEEIAKLFQLFAMAAGVLVVVGIIGIIIYFRWRAEGQERGM
ncbi:hypothetical protein ACFP81_14585 [Deinococcus lacus]|uniref:Uncharacterized protein n=1 Tax=Deinococcus lacus TaxID=392561 RepID=A0ABW1YIV5_9DEIO